MHDFNLDVTDSIGEQSRELIYILSSVQEAIVSLNATALRVKFEDYM